MRAALALVLLLLVPAVAQADAWDRAARSLPAAPRGAIDTQLSECSDAYMAARATAGGAQEWVRDIDAVLQVAQRRADRLERVAESIARARTSPATRALQRLQVTQLRTLARIGRERASVDLCRALGEAAILINQQRPDVVRLYGLMGVPPSLIPTWVASAMDRMNQTARAQRAARGVLGARHGAVNDSVALMRDYMAL